MKKTKKTEVKNSYIPFGVGVFAILFVNFEYLSMSPSNALIWTIMLIGGISIVAWLISLPVTNKKKAFNICFIILAIFYAAVTWFGFYAEQQLKERQWLEQLKMRLEQMSTYRDQQKSLDDYTICLTRDLRERRLQYLRKHSFTGIVQPGEQFMLESSNLVKYVYEDGKKIIKDIDSLQLKEDLQEMVEASNTLCRNYCILQNPNQKDFCTTIKRDDEEIQKYMDIGLSIMEKNRNLIHEEFKLIKCMHENYCSKKKCKKIIDSFAQKSKEYENYGQNVQKYIMDKAKKFP